MTPKKPSRRVPRTGWKLPERCTNPDCGKQNSTKERMVLGIQIIRDEEIECEIPKYHCEACGMSFQSPAQASEGVKLAVKIYQRKHQLLTGANLKSLRTKLGFSSAVRLAEASDGILSESTLKRIEGGVHAQDRSTDYLIRKKLEELEAPKKCEPEHFVLILDMNNNTPACQERRDAATTKENKEENWNEPFSELYAELAGQEQNCQGLVSC